MRTIHRVIRNFFGFSRSQTNAFVLLLPLMAVVIFSEPVYHWWVAHREPESTRDAVILDSLVAVWQKNSTVADSGLVAHTHEQRAFDFDPNKANKEMLQDLGFSSSLATRIIHYRNKGGTFRIKSDLLKIYRMDSLLYHRLYDHILLPVSVQPLTSKPDIKKDEPTPIPRFDINTADSIQLVKINGIGPKLSKRILTYRDKLGGFVSMRQMEEVWGLDTIVVKRLKDQAFVSENYVPVQINVNTAAENDLAAHPYLSRTAARTLVAYRFQHGGFATIEDLRKIQALDINTIQKITPYLRFQD